MGRRTTLERYGSKGTALGQVRGLGSAHEGVHHWLQQRFTAIGNLVLVNFLLISFILLPNTSYAAVADWIGSPLTATALALLIISTFWHARLGLQVVIEDYADRPSNKFALTVLVNLLIVAGAVFGLFCIATLSFRGVA